MINGQRISGDQVEYNNKIPIVVETNFLGSNVPWDHWINSYGALIEGLELIYLPPVL